MTAIKSVAQTLKQTEQYQTQLQQYENQLQNTVAPATFQDVAYYHRSPCFNGSGGYTDAERAAMAENRRLASELRKKANDALFQTVVDQQKALKNDAHTLERLQGAAQGARGQLQAIGYANEHL